jgi:ATP-binding cassette subfamily F protein uup
MAEGDGRFLAYAGGYSDMVAQRGEGVGMKQPEANAGGERKEAAPRPRPTRETAPKLSFSDQHALKTLPERIEAKNRDIAALQAELSDAGLYARDPEKFAKLSRRLAEAAAARDADEELWLALEMKREALES